MTDPRNNDFDEALKAMLGRRADESPQSDLAAGALSRARGIGRRRRIAAVIAVAAVIAAAAPVGASLLSDTTSDSSPGPANAPTGTSDPVATSPETTAQETTPTIEPPAAPITVDVSLAHLERGPDPSVPYLDAGSWVVDGASTPLEAPADRPIVDVAQFEEGVVLWLHNSDNGEVQMYPQGFESGFDPGVLSTSPTVDAATGAVAFVLEHETIYYGTSLSPDTVSAAFEGVTVSEILDAHDGLVVFTGQNGARHMVGQVDFTTAPPTYQPLFDPADSVEAASFSLTANLMGQTGQETVPGDPNDSRCGVLTDLDDVNDGGWSSCEWRSDFTFSPDGSRIFALDARTEGFGPREVAVLDSRTGDVLLDLTTPGTFGFWPSWEGNDTVLFTVVEEGRAAIVRCTVGFGCELASDPKPAAMDSLLDPYHLTTN